MSGYIHKEGFFRRVVRKRQKRQTHAQGKNLRVFALGVSLPFCFPLLLMAVLIMSADSMRMNSSLSESLIAFGQLVLITTVGWDAVSDESNPPERDTT